MNHFQLTFLLVAIIYFCFPITSLFFNVKCQAGRTGNLFQTGTSTSISCHLSKFYILSCFVTSNNVNQFHIQSIIAPPAFIVVVIIITIIISTHNDIMFILYSIYILFFVRWVKLVSFVRWPCINRNTKKNRKKKKERRRRWN